jgi:hypothetical protein
VEIDIVGAGVLGRSPEAISGVRGEFTLRDVPAGEIFIFASKASDGFPNSRIAVFSDGLASGTKVSVTEGNQTSGVTVTLRRGGRLSGFISDADTGKPVLAARLRVVRVDHPDWYFSSSPTRNGDFDFAVPAGRPYRLEVTASGYRAWTPAAEEIVLEPNMTRTLDIRLRKASTKNQLTLDQSSRWSR